MMAWRSSAVLLGLRLVAADDVADPVDDDLLGEELRLALAALDEERREGLRIVENPAHACVGALAHTQHIFQTLFL